MRLIPLSEIKIAENRQRKEISADDLMNLSNSLMSIGLLHPIVVREEKDREIILVAGERRLRAVEAISGLGQTFTHGGKPVPEGTIPCTYLKDLSPLEAMEAELEENIQRVDLTWQERSAATSQLFELRRLQAEKRGEPPPTYVEFAPEVYPKSHPTAALAAVREEIILSKFLTDPDVASASSRGEAIKVIRRKEETLRNAALGERVGRTFSVADHKLFKGDCLAIQLEPNSFDCILTDPPYGINAQDFGDSAGRAAAGGHTYDDSLSTWTALMAAFGPLSFTLAKPQAHCYVFCDIDNFLHLRELMSNAGWNVFRTPFVYHNPSSQRAPWPHTGPHRRYQLCLYAVKGSRPTLKLAADVLTYASDSNLVWPAQKPVALYTDLLSRTCRPGDSVLDPFCGTGTIFPAAHAMKVKATGVEIDPAAYGIAVQRLEALKGAG